MAFRYRPRATGDQTAIAHGFFRAACDPLGVVACEPWRFAKQLGGHGGKVFAVAGPAFGEVVQPKIVVGVSANIEVFVRQVPMQSP